MLSFHVKMFLLLLSISNINIFEHVWKNTRSFRSVPSALKSYPKWPVLLHNSNTHAVYMSCEIKLALHSSRCNANLLFLNCQRASIQTSHFFKFHNYVNVPIFNLLQIDGVQNITFDCLKVNEQTNVCINR